MCDGPLTVCCYIASVTTQFFGFFFKCLHNIMYYHTQTCALYSECTRNYKATTSNNSSSTQFCLFPSSVGPVGRGAAESLGRAVGQASGRGQQSSGRHGTVYARMRAPAFEAAVCVVAACGPAAAFLKTAADLLGIKPQADVGREGGAP